MKSPAKEEAKFNIGSDDSDEDDDDHKKKNYRDGLKADIDEDVKEGVQGEVMSSSSEDEQ